MAITDQLADFLTRIRNATGARQRFVDTDWSKIKANIAEILKNQGFIENYLVKQDTPQRGTIRIFLKYTEGRQPVIQGLKRISKPGKRTYIGYEDIPFFYGGLGLSIVSTSQGVLPGVEASKRKIGGELLCMVW